MRHGFPQRFVVALSLVASVATLSIAMAGCTRGASSSDAPSTDANASAATAVADPKPAPPGALAEATNAARTLHVAVLQAKRTQDTVRVELAFTYTPATPAGAAAPPTQTSQPQSQPQAQPQPAPEPLSLLRALGGIADASADANPADFCLLTADGAHRLFLLHGSQNKPVLEGDWQKPLHPAERRVLAATFPAPPPARAAAPGAVAEPAEGSPALSAAPAIAVRVTLVLGRVVLRDVPIS